MYGGGKGWGAPEGKGWGSPPGWYADPWHGGSGCGPDYGKGHSRGDMYGRPGPYDGCKGGMAMGMASSEDFSKDGLINRVKQIQRESISGREQWERYVDALRTGNRDPSRHTVEALSNFIEAIERGQAPERVAKRTLGDGRVLRLRGVPFQSTVAEVVEFLAAYKVPESQVTIGYSADGKRTGEAFAVFGTGAAAARALEEMQRQEIQGRYIELFRATHEERDEVARISEVGARLHTTGNSQKDDLVTKVKAVQRSDADGKELWYRFCDISRTGNRDPCRHSSQSLRAFLKCYESGTSPEHAARDNATPVLRLRGVPYQAIILDIVEFLADYDVTESKVSLGYGVDGRRSGEAYVEFASVEQAEEVLEEKQKQEIHGRYIELFRSSPEERDQETGAHRSAPSAESGNVNREDVDKEEVVARVKGIQRSSQEGRAQWEKYCDIVRTGNRDPIKHSVESLRNFLAAFEKGEMPTEAPTSCVLRLRGVPFQSDILDVVQFLEDYDIDNSNIVLGCNTDGRATGEAFVIFPSVDIAEQALEEKQKQEIRGRYIELFRSCMEDWEEATRMREALVAVDAGGMQVGSELSEKEDLVARVKGIQRSSRDGREQWEKFCGIMHTGNRDPIKHTVSSIRHFLECYAKGELPTGPPQSENHVLRLRGVPFQSAVADIITFLEDYDVDESQVVVGTDAKGKPTGEAIVAFASGELAERAMKEKQKKEIQGRYIEFFRSSQEEFDEAQSLAQEVESSTQRGGINEKDGLVNRVKGIQRSCQEGRDAWEKYCEALRTGAHDPSKHTPQSMRNFVEAYEQGDSPEMAAEKLSGGGKVLRLRGVPFQSGIVDVVKFLEDYKVDASQVAMGRGTDGRASGEAFVVFKTVKLAEKAMKERMKKEIRGRYIELFRSSSEDWNQAVALGGQQDNNIRGGDCSFDDLVARVKQIQRSDISGKEMWYEYCDSSGTGNRDPTRHTSDSLRAYLEAYDKGEKPVAPQVGDGRWLRLRGVPFQCKAVDVVAFLLEYDIDESDVTMTSPTGGKGSGEAYVIFPTAELAEHALEDKNRHEIQGRYIELFRSSLEERDRVLARREVIPDRDVSGPGPVLPPNAPTLVLKGLPFSAKAPDIVSFLLPHSVHTSQVAIAIGADKRPSGEAFIALPHVDIAEAIFRDKHKQSMGARYIEIMRTTFDRWIDAGGNPHGGRSWPAWDDVGGYGPTGGYASNADYGPYGKGWGPADGGFAAQKGGWEASKGSAWRGGEYGWEGKGAPYGACGSYPKGDAMSGPYGKGVGKGWDEWSHSSDRGKGYEGPDGKGWGKPIGWAAEGNGYEGYGKGGAADYGKGADHSRGAAADYGGDAYYGKGPDYGRGFDYGKGADHSRGADYGPRHEYGPRHDYGKGMEYSGGRDYSTGSDWGKGADYGDTHDYGKGIDYGRGAEYRRDADYGKGADYGRSADYERGADYGKGAEYGRSADYGRVSDYGKGAEYERSADYGRGSDYGKGADYRKSMEYGTGGDYRKGAGWGRGDDYNKGGW